MKKIVFIIVFLFVLLINFTDTNDSEEIRFRVIANSNEQNDQALKMKIVNKLKNENISLDNLGILKSKVEYIVLSNNYNYKVDVCIKNQEYVVDTMKTLENIWDEGGSFIDDNTLSVHISRLREKIGPEHIVTVRGIGYRWEDSKWFLSWFA